MNKLAFIERYLKVNWTLFNVKGSLVVGSFVPVIYFLIWSNKDFMQNQLGNNHGIRDFKAIHQIGLVDWMNNFYGLFAEYTKSIFGFTDGFSILIFSIFFAGSFMWLCFTHLGWVAYELNYQIRTRRGENKEEVIAYLDKKLLKKEQE